MANHFIGLGGIGMSALARILLQKGKTVQGSDLKLTPLLEELQKEGAKIQVGHDEAMMQNAERVIYSTDIKADNIEFLTAKQKALPIIHRADLLDELMHDKTKLLVTGTHGKTTTTALLASVLLEAKLDPSFVIGGILQSLNTNGQAGSGAHFVAEADESDGSFLKTPADYAIITNLENDHLNYWGTQRALDLAFKQFIGQTKHLFWCYDDPRLHSLKPKGVSYGFSDKADFPISRFRQTERGIVFDLGAYTNIELNLLGRHNALNGAAVFSLSMALNIPESAVRKAFQKFSGTGRRLECKGHAHKVTVFDDYGHHPTEIAATIKALRDHVREKRLVVVFQPHRYSRVKDLLDDFPLCFDDADEVFMTDIFAANEEPILGVSSAVLYTRLRERLGSRVHFLPRTHLELGVAATLKPLDVVLTIGAGDITKAGIPILQHYASRAPKYTVGVLFGGTSAEHPVSIMSAKNIIHSLDTTVYNTKLFRITTDGKWVEVDFPQMQPKTDVSPSTILQELLKCDVCIPVFHGPQGEDGMIGGVLDALQIPYVGCDYRSGAVCMHKAWTKYIALNHNVPTTPFIEATRPKDKAVLIQKIEETLPYPVWVKPVHLGSSIGVSRASNQTELMCSLALAFNYDHTIIIEKEVVGREIEFSILGNEYIQIALPGEIVSHGEFVAYDKKYGAGAMAIRVPALISEEEKQMGLELAEKVYRACDCKGLARVDFFLDEKGHYWFNEINPFPGFTDTSAYPKMWETTGLDVQQLTDWMIALALHRARQIAEVRGKQ